MRWLACCIAAGTAAALLAVLCQADPPEPAWCVQGVIDWKSLGGAMELEGARVVLKWLDRDGWHLEDGRDGGALRRYVLMDKDILLPKSSDVNALKRLRILAGGAAIGGRGAPAVAGYRIWAWLDSNHNGRADARDASKAWRNVFSVDLAKDPGNRTVDLLVPVPPGKELALRAGLTYLLVLEIVMADGSTNFHFTSGAAVERIGKPAEPGPLNATWFARAPRPWRPDGENPFAVSHNGSGPMHGVDDSEVLWIRVNNPPGAPG